MSMRQWPLVAAFVLALGLSACATTPRETVVLADVMGQQLAELQRSHEQFVRLHYRSQREAVQRFMEEQWIPRFMNNAFEDQDSGFPDAFSEAVDNLLFDPTEITRKIERSTNLNSTEKAIVLDAFEEARRDGRAEMGDLMIGFAQGAMAQIEIQRQSMLEPIDRQESIVLERLSQAYADVQLSHITIRSHLNSAVELQESRDQVARKLGILEEQQQFVQQALDLSDKAASALKAVKRVEGAVDAIDDGLEKYNEHIEAFEALLEKVRSQ